MIAAGKGTTIAGKLDRDLGTFLINVRGVKVDIQPGCRVIVAKVEVPGG